MPTGKSVRHFVGALFVSALLAAAPLQSSSAAEAPAANTIVMKNFDFSPMSLTIKAGGSVTWKNLDGEPHTVTSADGLFRSPALDENDTYSFTFTRPGVYKYICSIHPRMMATVTVK